MMTWGEYLDSFCDDETYRNYREAKRKIRDEIYAQEQEKALEKTVYEKLWEVIEGMFNGG